MEERRVQLLYGELSRNRTESQASGKQRSKEWMRHIVGIGLDMFAHGLAMLYRDIWIWTLFHKNLGLE